MVEQRALTRKELKTYPSKIMTKTQKSWNKAKKTTHTCQPVSTVCARIVKNRIVFCSLTRTLTNENNVPYVILYI